MPSRARKREKKRKNNRKKTKIIVDLPPKLWQKALVLFDDSTVLSGIQTIPAPANANGTPENTMVKKPYNKTMAAKLNEFLRENDKLVKRARAASKQKKVVEANRAEIIALLGKPSKDSIGKVAGDAFAVMVPCNLRGDLVEVKRVIGNRAPKPYSFATDSISKVS